MARRQTALSHRPGEGYPRSNNYYPSLYTNTVHATQAHEKLCLWQYFCQIETALLFAHFAANRTGSQFQKEPIPLIQRCRELLIPKLEIDAIKGNRFIKGELISTELIIDSALTKNAFQVQCISANVLFFLNTLHQ